MCKFGHCIKDIQKSIYDRYICIKGIDRKPANLYR